MSEFNDYKWYDDDYSKNIPAQESNESFSSGGPTFTVNQKKKKVRPHWMSAAAGALAGIMVTGAAFGSYLIWGSPKASSSTTPPQTSNMVIDENASFNYSQLSTGTGEEKSVSEIARDVGPTVVGITNKAQVQSFFGVTEQEGSGSGVIVSSDGYILTNNHVIEDADELLVQTSTGEEYSAKVVGADAISDLAVIKIEPNEALPVATLGESANLQVGELAVAIGNPLGLELAGSVTVGVISAVNRSIETDNGTMTLLQTDAAINPGNSGGALVNSRGEVIGINTMKFSGEDVEGIGFAIPMDIAKPIMEDLISTGYVKGRPSIGITIQQITDEIAFRNDLPIGLYISSVTPGGAADEAGLQRGDVIIKANDQRIETADELTEIKNSLNVGDTIVMEIVRDDQRMTVNVVLQEDRANQ